MATYTPCGRLWAKARAPPRLNRPSLEPKAIGIMAPVRTTVLSVIASPSRRAVCSMVSVPWVTTMRSLGHLRHWERITARSSSSMSRLSTIMRVRISTSARQRPDFSISRRWVSLKKSRPVRSSYSLSKVPPVTKTRMGSFMAVTPR